MAIRHKRRSNRPDNGDVGAVQPSDWNEDHEADGLVGELLKLGSQSDVVAYLGADKKARFTALTEAARTILGTASYASLLATMGAVAKAGDSMSGDLSMTGNRVTGVGSPSSASDAATKAYVDALAMVVSGALVFKGAWDASEGTFPGGGDAQVGWFYLVTGAGDVDGQSFSVGDNIYAMSPNASASEYSGEWIKIEGILTRDEIEGALGFALGTASAQNVEAFATAAQGAKADSAVQPESLGTAAFQNASAFATAAQGTKADGAIPASQKAVASGVATLDADGKIPANQLPSGGANGTVTSVGLDVPTGFAVSNSPVSTSGTLTLSYASGYRGYTDAEATKLSGIAAGAQTNVVSDWNATTGDARILNKPTIPAPLSFTPVQQGGGWEQLSNKIHLGWSGTGVKIQVDASDQGTIWTSANLNPANIVQSMRLSLAGDTTLTGASGGNTIDKWPGSVVTGFMYGASGAGSSTVLTERRRYVQIQRNGEWLTVGYSA